ncbi:MAG: phosphotransferase family protein [Acidimicrobiales bacterium]
MIDSSGRDDAALAAGVADWLTALTGADGVEVTGLRRPSVGYSSETVFFEATWSAGGARHERALVLRLAPTGGGSFPAYDLTAQWQAQQAAAGAGVPVADPLLETDPRWIGEAFIVMPRIDGHIVGALAHRDPWILGLPRSDRATLYRNFVGALARVHRSDLPAHGSIPRRDNTAELDHWDHYLRWSSDGAPVAVLADALGWCRRHQPATEPAPALLWGDVRLENAVIGDDLRPRAVLDWDMTSIGAPEHDLAWLTALELTMEDLFGERTPGFPERDGTVTLFEDLAGRRTSDLAWYETLAMVRSAAVMTRISYLRRDTGQPLMLPIDDNPVLDLIRRRTA